MASEAEKKSISLITKLLIKNHNILQFHKQLIINHILERRNICASKIQSLFLKFHFRLKLNKNKLLNKLLQQREKSAIKLVSLVTALKYKYKIKKFLKKQKQYYTLPSSFNKNDLKLKLFLDNGEIKEYKVEYNKILDKYVCFVPRKEIFNLNVKANFVNEQGNIIVDPEYASNYEENTFYNIINFRKILREEATAELERKNFIKKYFLKQRNKLTSAKSSYNLLKNGNKNSLSKYGKNYGTMMNLGDVHDKIKGILKGRPLKRVPSNRRLTFGTAQFSY
jgi:hypothetical protein